MPLMTYPPTQRVDVVDELFNLTLADPYRWLENDVRSDAEVASWVEAQNSVTYSYLNELAGRTALQGPAEAVVRL